jgi:hypothetical protein
LSALVYGCNVMFKSRPVYNVFVVDRFEVIPANAVEEEWLDKAAPQFRSVPVTGPKVVGAREPSDPKRLADIVISASSGGPDLSNYPDLYVPYDDVKARAAQAAKPLAELAKRQPQDVPVIKSFIAESGRAEDAIGFLPMSARNRDMAVVVDRKAGDIVGIVPVNPW